MSMKLGTLVQIIRFDNSSNNDPEADHGSVLFNTYSKICVRSRQKQLVPVDSLYSISSTSNSDDIIENMGIEQIGPSKVTKLRELNLDFALDFGASPLPENLLTIPRFGVWSFRNDDGTRNHASPDCFCPKTRTPKVLVGIQCYFG